MEEDRKDLSKRPPQPAIHGACEDGDIAAVRAELAYGCPVDLKWMRDFTPLQIASLEGHLEVVALLIEHGADINFRDGDTGMAPLHNASIRGHLEICELLLAHGAQVNVIAEDGSTPLIDAASNNDDVVPVTQLLIERGAKINHQGISGTTALHEAARSGAHSVAALLLKCGADKSLTDEDEVRACDIAEMAGYMELAELLR